MKRKHKTYSKPKRPFDKERIDSEAIIKEEFGLKNKKEIWKADAKIKSIREKAKKLIPAGEKEQKEFFSRLNKIGFEVNSIAEVLSLNKEDYLKRRLQTLVVSKKLAYSSKHARQLITHRKILVDEKIVNKPSFIVPIALEGKITSKIKIVPKKVSAKKENKVEESSEEKKEEKTKKVEKINEIPKEIKEKVSKETPDKDKK